MVEEFAGKNHINYLAACGELGTAYNRVGNRKKALENQLLMREGLLKSRLRSGKYAFPRGQQHRRDLH